MITIVTKWNSKDNFQSQKTFYIKKISFYGLNLTLFMKNITRFHILLYFFEKSTICCRTAVVLSVRPLGRLQSFMKITFFTVIQKRNAPLDLKFGLNISYGDFSKF